MMVVAVFTKFTKNHRIVNLKWVDFRLCRMFLHKVVEESPFAEEGGKVAQWQVPHLGTPQVLQRC